MQNSIQHTVFYPHPPEAVWEYLTRPELIKQWLMETDFEPIVGYDFHFKTKAIPKLEFDGMVYCKVLEVVPPKKLTYSWKGGPGEGKITMDSIVRWTLTPKNNGTELFLDHSGFKVLTNIDIFNSMNEGWWKNMNKILELLQATHQTTK
jgi:uncharacterized protein YndB with AHSA1/START domain